MRLSGRTKQWSSTINSKTPVVAQSAGEKSPGPAISKHINNAEMTMFKLTKLLPFLLLCSCGTTKLTERSELSSPSTAITNEAIENHVPGGWRIEGQVLRFVPENLYEHINGRAEFYLAYNVVSLAFANFEKPGEEKYIHVSVYDMGTPTNAFGAFSAERSEGETPLALGRDAYQSGADCYVWKGQYYIQIITLDEAGELSEIALKIARGLTGSLFDPGTPVLGLDLLPHKDRIPHTERYFLADAFGLDFLTDTYTAKYRKSDAEVIAFVSRRKADSEAASIVQQYAQYARRYGKNAERVAVGDAALVVCDMGGRFDVVSQKGRLVNGVLDVPDRDLAVQAATEFRQQLEND